MTSQGARLVYLQAGYLRGKVSKLRLHPCTCTKALYRPYGPVGGVEV